MAQPQSREEFQDYGCSRQPDHCDWQSERICPAPGFEEGIRIHHLQYLFFV